MSDPVIERLEAELRESRFKPWDVETLLVDRHRAKIEALTKPDANKWRRAWQATQELGMLLLAYVGLMTVVTLLGVTLLTGEWPLRRGMLDTPVIINPIAPPTACPMPAPPKPVGKLTIIPGT